MLQLTTDATKHLMRASAERGDKGARIPRLARQAGKIRLGFAPSPERGDKVVDASGVKLLVAEDIAEHLDAAIMDVRLEDDGRPVLILRRRNGPPSAHV